MRVVLGGKFESALIRALDGDSSTHFNSLGHPYYMGLNRDVNKTYLDRLGTFLAIFHNVLIANADWSDQGKSPVSSRALGVVYDTDDLRKFNEWDKDVTSFAEMLFAKRAFSEDVLNYVAETNYARDKSGDLPKVKSQVSLHYICRLIAQARIAQAQDCLFIIDEGDARIFSEIRDFVLMEKPNLNFDLPDIDHRAILGQDFAGGLFNFSSHDISSIKRIREDLVIRDYASQVRYHLSKSKDSVEAQKALLSALRKTYRVARLETRGAKIFETLGWTAKVLHITPVVGQGVTLLEDAKDAVLALAGKDKTSRSWHLLASKAQEIDIEEYLGRKGNIG